MSNTERASGILGWILGTLDLTPAQVACHVSVPPPRMLVVLKLAQQQKFLILWGEIVGEGASTTDADADQMAKYLQAVRTVCLSCEPY